jgi:hypothetical protein
MLPQRALTLISEYSKPMTRPDWKKYKPMTRTYYYIMINNTRKNEVLRKFIINNCPEYTYTIDNLPFTLKVGQCFVFNQIKYIITQILPNYTIILNGSNGLVYRGESYIYYKNRLSNGFLRRMEGILIKSNNKIYLDINNYKNIL